MSATVKTGTSAGGGPARRRRRVVLSALAAGCLAVVGALAVVLTGSSEGAPGSAAVASSPPTESSSPPSASSAPFTPADPAAPPVPADELPAALPAVALTEPVVVDEIRGSLVSIDPVDATATGPGNVAGPALRVTVRIENGTGAALSLDEVSVNVFHGADGRPASPIEDSSQRWFHGVLAVDEATDGVYVFRVPPEQRDLVTVQVGYRAGAPIAVFAGPIG